MNDSYVINPIAYIENPLNTKFGVPRQSGLADSLVSKIVFTEEYNVPESLRGLEDFSHIWLIWGFSQARGKEWSPTVRPPRLGGNQRVGVFATRSPYRPNSLALSCVKILSIEKGVITVAGADLMNGTPIYDIKPYLPYADCVPQATGGFAPDGGKVLKVACEEELLSALSKQDRDALIELLSRDPRPQYHDDAERIYGMSFGNFEIKFRVCENNLIVETIELIDKV